MKLIKLNDTYAGPILVNPDKINLIKRSLEKKCTLYMDGNEVHEVLESEEEILFLIDGGKKK